MTAPATQWFLAEGATGPYFDLFVLIANPERRGDAQVQVTYLLPDGTDAITRPDRAGQQRAPTSGSTARAVRRGRGFPLADTAVSTTVESTNGVPDRPSARCGGRATARPGTRRTTRRRDTPGTGWALAEGEVGGTRATIETYILIANTSASPGARR